MSSFALFDDELEDPQRGAHLLENPQIIPQRSTRPSMYTLRTMDRSQQGIDNFAGSIDSTHTFRSTSQHPHAFVGRAFAPQLRILVPTGTAALPATPSSSNTSATTSSPPSDTPHTPSSATSPIAGVVDLTKNVTTISKDVAAHGGLSDIYKGEWRRVRDCGIEIVPVAVKLLRVLTWKDQDGVRARKRLNREVYVWHRLEHPNVVKLFGTSYHISGRPAMVMQWYENGNATEYLANRNPGANRLQLILDVARGLEYLHTQKPQIVHADLKGNNVLITDDGRAALADFGLSQVIEDLGRPAGLSLSNPDVGPLRWQAPEFLEGDDDPPTPMSDVWSFGCTAFELLTSQIPYAHRVRDAQVIRDMHNHVAPSGPSGCATRLASFDPRLTTLLERCWSFEPTNRPHMTDIRIQLEALCL